ncbi:hypothetical protein NIES2101_04660 [Calothrix sp. HK-06]|nr:hypothetical protein NIES2101_04660 [Calothrix sp. HK-06]
MSTLIGVLFVVVYVSGIWKFWNGFEKTNFQRSLPNRLILSSLWPVLLIANKSYRRNFRKALKG